LKGIYVHQLCKAKEAISSLKVDIQLIFCGIDEHEADNDAKDPKVIYFFLNKEGKSHTTLS